MGQTKAGEACMYVHMYIQIRTWRRDDGESRRRCRTPDLHVRKAEQRTRRPCTEYLEDLPRSCVSSALFAPFARSCEPMPRHARGLYLVLVAVLRMEFGCSDILHTKLAASSATDGLRSHGHRVAEWVLRGEGAQGFDDDEKGCASRSSIKGQLVCTYV